MGPALVRKVGFVLTEWAARASMRQTNLYHRAQVNLPWILERPSCGLICAEEVVFPGFSLLIDTEVSALHEEGTLALDTYRHAIQWELSMDFKLVRRCQPPAGVQQDIIELEGQEEMCGLKGSFLPLSPPKGVDKSQPHDLPHPLADRVLGLSGTKCLPHSPERTFAVGAPSQRVC